MIDTFRKRRTLGVAIDERAIHLAEFSAGGGVPRLARFAVLNFAEGMSWDDPAAIGRALREVVQRSKLSAGRVVVGLPSRWVMVVPQALPPLTPAAAVDAMNLLIERDYPGDAQRWCFDYAGAVDPVQKSTVLLAATPRDRVTAVLTALTEAGITAERITSTTMALACVSAGADKREVMLEITSDGSTMASTRDGQITRVDRLASVQASSEKNRIDSLAAQVRRAIDGLASDETRRPDRLVIWDCDGHDEAALLELGRVLGVETVVNPGLAQQISHASPQGQALEPAMMAGAIALAKSSPATDRERSIDYLHSKLTPAKRSDVTRLRIIGTVAAAALLSAIVYFGVDWYVELGEVAQMRSDLAAMKDEVATAREIVERTRAAEGWFDDRPPMLGCLRDLTQAFPTSGQVSATSLTLRDDRTGTLGGRAQTQEGAFDLLDRLASSGRFSQVKMVYVRQADRSGPGVAFALTFVHKGGE